MNDERAGQLTQDWQIPQYAQGHLWLDTESGAAPCEGPHGLFQLEFPAQVVTIRWGQEGPPLAQLRWQPDTLAWDGSVRVGGLVDALHSTEFDEMPLAIALATLSAQPLLHTTQPFGLMSTTRALTAELPRYVTGVDDTWQPLPLPLLTPDESPLVAAAHDSLVSSVPLHVYGRLAEEAEGWHRHVALPIIWEAVTLFTP